MIHMLDRSERVDVFFFLTGEGTARRPLLGSSVRSGCAAGLTSSSAVLCLACGPKSRAYWLRSAAPMWRCRLYAWEQRTGRGLWVSWHSSGLVVWHNKHLVLLNRSVCVPFRSDHSCKLRVSPHQHPVIVRSVAAAGGTTATDVAAAASAEHQPRRQHVTWPPRPLKRAGRPPVLFLTAGKPRGRLCSSYLVFQGSCPKRTHCRRSLLD